MKKALIVAITCFIMGSSGYGALPALADNNVRKTRPCNISASVEWDIEEDNKVITGSFNLRATGILTLNKDLRNPISKMQGNLKYDIEDVNVSYSYHERITEKESPFCPENPVLEEWSGSGSIRFGRGTPSGMGLYIRNAGTMEPPEEMVKGVGAQQFLAALKAQAPKVVTNYYEFFGYGPPDANAKTDFVVSGRKRKVDCTFRDAEKKISPSISLRFKFPKDGKLKDERSWSANYYGGLSLFRIGISDLPETMEKNPYRPARSSSGDISYKVSWSFEELKPEIRIYQVKEHTQDGFKDITDSETRTIIGEKIKLFAKPLGLLGSEMENPQWKIDGKFIKDYKVTGDNAEFEGDDKVDLENKEISFAWIRGDFSGKPLQVEVSGDVGGKDATAKTTFKVFAPKITQRNVHCSSHVTLGVMYDASNKVERPECRELPGNIKENCPLIDADPEKYYDNIKKHCAAYPGLMESVCDISKMEPGFEAEHAIDMPYIPNQGYALQYVQLVMEDASSTNFDGTSKHKENKEWCLDTSYPYTRQTFPSLEKKTQARKEDHKRCPGPWCSISMNDTPEIPLEQPGSSKVLLDASIVHSFQAYLMFRPSARDSHKESLWVPLAKVTWGWSVEVTRKEGLHWTENVPCNEAYTINNKSAPSESGCHETNNPKHPEWGCNVVKNDF